MQELRHPELMQSINNLQWALGDSVIKARKLKVITDKESDPSAFSRKLEALINSLLEISRHFRHEIADELKSRNH